MAKLISVVMPIYNGGIHLQVALKSILKQTYKNIEIIAINDASTDASLEVLESQKDSRIKIINNTQNMKLVRTLNRGLDASTGDYIVRMDQDDIAFPKRIELQLDYMSANPDVAVLGSWFEFIGLRTILKFPSDHEGIRHRLLCMNSVGHPTAMMNRNLLGDDLYYSENHEYAEDYELWCRISRKYKIENLKKNLLKYRIHATQISTVFAGSQSKVVNSIRLDNLSYLGVKGSEKELQYLAQIFDESKESKPSIETREFGQYLVAQNHLLGVYSKTAFESFIEASLNRNRVSVFSSKNKIRHNAEKLINKITALLPK